MSPRRVAEIQAEYVLAPGIRKSMLAASRSTACPLALSPVLSAMVVMATCADNGNQDCRKSAW